MDALLICSCSAFPVLMSEHDGIMPLARIISEAGGASRGKTSQTMFAFANKVNNSKYQAKKKGCLLAALDY
ncbi:hypothetical protein [Aquitalea sp. LB_tupeE]|uniref:hypothetical protein n=1 Tax=Aquitalea sp. LB_tupeE TaxID=2748078 RepID=UPI0015BE8157|nr:hypothetical protein [Aquitalea sp. LB_tupeE]NWK79888.1 hypothetical protein [Aquitalea sp. LB_tupeE]